MLLCCCCCCCCCWCRARCIRGGNVHAIIRRGKNERTAEGWIRWTFPLLLLSSFSLLFSSISSFSAQSFSSFLPFASNPASSLFLLSERLLSNLMHRERRENAVGSRIAPRATALLYVEQPSPPSLQLVPSRIVLLSSIRSSPEAPVKLLRRRLHGPAHNGILFWIDNEILLRIIGFWDGRYHYSGFN